MRVRIDDDWEDQPPLDPDHKSLWLLGLGSVSREKVIRASRETHYSVGELAFFISCALGEKLTDLCHINPVRPQSRRRWPVPPRVL